MDIKRRHSLSFRQAIITVLTVFVIGLAASLYQIAVDLKQEKHRIDQTVNQVLSLLKLPAAQAAFNLDNNLAEQVVHGLFAYEPIYQAEIKDDLGGVLATLERPPVNSNLRYLASLLVGSSRLYQLPLVWKGRVEPVGSVTVRVDSYLATADFFDRAGLTLLFGIIRNLVLALLLSVIFYHKLAKPLINTAASFARTDPSDYSAQKIEMPQGHHKDEIGLLVDTVNRVLDEYRLHIRQQEESEAELNRLRNLLSNVVDSMPSSLICVDVDTRVIQWNRQTEAFTGIRAADAINRDLVNVYPLLKQEMPQVRAAIRKGLSSHDHRLRAEVNGEVQLYDVTIYPLTTNGIDGAVIRVDDVTERVRIEEMVMQSEKMLSIGGLAAGMAHEINNPLAGILQNIQVIKNRTRGELLVNKKAAQACGTSIEAVAQYLSSRKVYDMIERIQESGRRAAKIVENMLSFSRKSRNQFEPMDFVELMEQSLELAANDYGIIGSLDFRQIEIQREYADSLPHVACEGSQIQQVLLNILQNGAHAMSQSIDPDCTPKFIIRMRPEPASIRVEIEDNGPGISEEEAKRIFEPFFTTKPIGEGTGLGLSVSFFIVTENYGGELYVEPVPDGGARFVLRLPSLQATAQLESS